MNRLYREAFSIISRTIWGYFLAVTHPPKRRLNTEKAVSSIHLWPYPVRLLHPSMSPSRPTTALPRAGKRRLGAVSGLVGGLERAVPGFLGLWFLAWDGFLGGLCLIQSSNLLDEQA